MICADALDPTVAGLIELYADLGVEGVKTDANARSLFEENRKDSQFNGLLQQVKEIAAQLERATEGQAPVDQVRSALALLNSLRRYKDRQRYAYELALCRYGRYWTQAQRDYAEMAYRKLAWHDFFLSFTSHNPAADAVQLINTQHKNLIIHTLGQVFKAPDTVRTNMFARVLHYYLVNGQLQGYYDPESRGPGYVTETLRREAASALTFVQILQNSMFTELPSYCKIEYEAAAEDESKTMVFVISGCLNDLIKRWAVDNSLQAWYDAIVVQHITEIQPAEKPNQVKGLVATIKTQIVEKVAEARANLIENVPT